MDIVFKAGIKERILQEQNLSIEFGPGIARSVPDAITIDRLALDTVDIVCDLEKGIPLPDNSVEYAFSSHFLEHVSDLVFFMKEVHRVLKPGGIFESFVPHFSNPYYYSDPTHRTPFGLYTMCYFASQPFGYKRKIPTFYFDFGFKIEEIRLIFKSKVKLIHKLKRSIQWLFNLHPRTQERYEEFFCYTFPAFEIFFRLRK